MKLSSNELFGRGRHEAQDDDARADEATVDDTAAPRGAYDDAAAARPTFTPAGDTVDGPALVRGDVVSDTPVTSADDGRADEPVTRTRMAYDRPAPSGEPAAHDEPDAYDRPAAYDEPGSNELGSNEPRYSEPGYNEPGRRPVSAVTDAPAGADTVAGGVQPADGSYPALDPDETTPAGVAEPTGTSAGVPRQATRMADRPGSALNAGPMADLDQPLLGDAEFASQWQRVQAGFVDDPRVAVSEAADLVEQAGQALADALRERQTRLRALWDNNGANGAGQGEAGTGDTEELRLMIRRYRGLFDQLSHL